MKQLYAMKLCYLTAITGISVLVGSIGTPITMVNAQNTWVSVYRNVEAPTPGTLGEKLGMWGEQAWVDAQSIVRKGDYVYYNISIAFLRKPGRVPSNFKHGEGGGRQANCATRETFSIHDQRWTPFGDSWEGAAARFACR
jgi:hypothetical protein